jgi:hypothetical protein
MNQFKKLFKLKLKMNLLLLRIVHGVKILLLLLVKRVFLYTLNHLLKYHIGVKVFQLRVQFGLKLMVDMKYLSTLQKLILNMLLLVEKVVLLNQLNI